MTANISKKMLENEAIGAAGLCHTQLHKNPVVKSNGDAVFSIHAPGAESVLVVGMGDDTAFWETQYSLQPGEKGYWTTTISGLRPGFHYFSFIVDGMNVTNPEYPLYYGWAKATNGLEIPDQELDFYHMKDVPHGDVRNQWYYSKLTGKQRRILVYTPPSYEANNEHKYPTLYLQHGSGESETAWLWQGKINNIMDNLLAEGKAQEMVIVMDYGYAYAEGDKPNAKELRKNNIFTQVLVEDLIPFIENRYRVIGNREHRAIAGFSMGGFHALNIGLGSLELFTCIGAISSGHLSKINPVTAYGGVLSDPKKINSQLKLLFISTGTMDGRYDLIKEDHIKLTQMGIRHEWFESPGSHEWQACRRHVHKFLQMLFR